MFPLQLDSDFRLCIQKATDVSCIFLSNFVCLLAQKLPRVNASIPVSFVTNLLILKLRNIWKFFILICYNVYR